MHGNLTTYQLFTTERMDRYLAEAAHERLVRAAAQGGQPRSPRGASVARLLQIVARALGGSREWSLIRRT